MSALAKDILTESLSSFQCLQLVTHEPNNEQERRIIGLMRDCARAFGSRLLDAHSPHDLDLIVQTLVWDENYTHMRTQLINELLQSPNTVHEFIDRVVDVDKVETLIAVLGEDCRDDAEAYGPLFDTHMQVVRDFLTALKPVIDKTREFDVVSSDDVALIAIPVPFRPLVVSAASAELCSLGVSWVGLQRKQGNEAPAYNARKWVLDRWAYHTQEHLKWVAPLAEVTLPPALGLEPYDWERHLKNTGRKEELKKRLLAQRGASTLLQKHVPTIPPKYLQALEESQNWLKGSE